MKVAGAFVFVLAVFVNSIVCPSRVADSLHGPGLPVFRVVEASARELPGVFYQDESNPVSGIQPVRTHLDIVARGNTIIGWHKQNYVRPIYNEFGNMIKMEIEEHQITRISLEEAEKLGVFSQLPEYATRQLHNYTTTPIEARPI